ncbi:MAG: hypothetical protein U0559_01785 [Anaerolineae bacterium]
MRPLQSGSNVQPGGRNDPAWGNNGSGVYISHGSHDNRIDQNNLGRNLQAGVTIASANANIVQQNSIGFSLSGEVMGNSVSGVELLAGASSNQTLPTPSPTTACVWRAAPGRYQHALQHRARQHHHDQHGRWYPPGKRPQFNSIGSPTAGRARRATSSAAMATMAFGWWTKRRAYNWVLGNNVGLNADQTAAQPN